MRWSSISLVAQREVRERGRTRAFVISTVILVVAALALVLLPSILGGGGDDPKRIAVSTSLPRAAAAMEAVGRALDEPVSVERIGPEDAREWVETGRADVALVAGSLGPVRIVVSQELDGGLRAVISQALAQARVDAALEGAGLSAQRRADIMAAPQLEVTALDPMTIADGDRLVGVVAAVVLTIALVMAGMVVAMGVAEEKTSRIAEVLLAALRPGELLAGKVIGIGLLSLGQLLAMALPAVAVGMVVGAVELPDATLATVAVTLVWFVLGYALYAAAFGSLGALVSRQQEVGQAVAPLSYLLWGGYLLVVFGAADVEALWFRLASLLPPLSPLLMPLRSATGTVSLLEVVLAMVATALCALALIWLGGRVYRGGLIGTGPRISTIAALRRAVGR